MSEVIIHDPGNNKQIFTLYVWVSVDENGLEGIVAGPIPGIGFGTYVTSNKNLLPLFDEGIELLKASTTKKFILKEYNHGTPKEN